MLKKLFEDALLATSYASSDSESVQRAKDARRPVIEAQIELVKQAMRLLKSVRTDVEALRLDDSDYFAGTGKCEFGHEGVEVTLEWPNLSILSDDIESLLKTVDKLDNPKVWFVLFGDCSMARVPLGFHLLMFHRFFSKLRERDQSTVEPRAIHLSKCRQYRVPQKIPSIRLI